MKKILLTAATTAMLFSTAIAGPEGTAYVKLAGGVNKADKLGGAKSKTVGFAEIGVGYNAMENVRVDLTATHVFNPEYKSSGSYGDGNVKVSYQGKNKLDIDTLLVNAYVDLFDAGMAKFYVGAGAGAAMYRDKYSGSQTMIDPNTGALTTIPFSPKSKRKGKFAGKVEVGASAELAEGVSLDVAYSYRFILINTKSNTYKKDTLNSHNGSVGVRFSL